MTGTTVTKDHTSAVLAAIKALAKDRVLVGIPAEKADRDPDPDEPNPEINNAEIGYLNEFGAPEQNLPARPHLVPGIQRVLPKITEAYKQAGKLALDGNVSAIRAAETKIGFMATSSVKNLIAEGLSPALSERTLDERNRRGVTRTNPLQDTGQYRNNIDFVVRPAAGVKVEKP